MSRRFALICGTLAVLGVGRAARAGAQGVRGRVVDSISARPLPGALAELRDDHGKVLQQVVTGSNGGYAFATAAGEQYQVRVAAIGYVLHAPVKVTATAELQRLPDILVTPSAITLPALQAMGTRRACGVKEVNPETFGGLLENAHAALQVMDATIHSGRVQFEMQLVHSTIMHSPGHDSTRSADTSAAQLRSWPGISVDDSVLHAHGFSQPLPAERGGGSAYYGPDLQVLFSDWFLDGHCFTLDQKASRGDSISIRFEPAHYMKNVDVSGVLVLDRATLALRGMSYEYRNLPTSIPARAAGGDMRFSEISPGLWVPTDWALWAPITRAPERQVVRIVLTPGRRGAPPPMATPSTMDGPRVVGREEQRGHVTRIVAQASVDGEH